MKTTIITTTINVPRFLDGYRDDAAKHERKVDYVVVGDLKSHPDTASYCQSIPGCTYLDVYEQNEYMRKFPALAEHLPYNAVERRNVGMLWAYENNTDVFIMVDDDNFAVGQDAVGKHKIVGTSPVLPTYRNDWGWINVCSFLQEKNNVAFYHRGFPPSKRWPEYDDANAVNESRRVVVNAGLWLDNPDTDAITRLERPLDVIGFKSGWKGNVALAPGYWSPFNCQNTALLRDVVPAYFLTPHIGRHSDIWASYVINRLAHRFDDVIAFGEPLAFHKRSPHDLWVDFDLERRGIQLTDGFCEALKRTNVSSDSYHAAFGEIAEGLHSWARNNGQEKVVEGMLLWHRSFTNLGAK